MFRHVYNHGFVLNPASVNLILKKQNIFACVCMCGDKYSAVHCTVLPVFRKCGKYVYQEQKEIMFSIHFLNTKLWSTLILYVRFIQLVRMSHLHILQKQQYTIKLAYIVWSSPIYWMEIDHMDDQIGRQLLRDGYFSKLLLVFSTV